tara:strand:+ start:656 stop:1699 length:1044 start_codon:yes stop_codon:yes gene_type:complete
MLFYISTDENYGNALNLQRKRLGKFWFYHDSDWTFNDATARKGISNNWCEIDFSKGCKISHNKIRDFPLWYNTNSCTNIEKLENYLPTDAVINYEDKWHVSYNPILRSEKKLDQASCEVLAFNVLKDNVTEFARTNDKPVVISENNGLDSLLVRSVFDHLKIPYTVQKIKKRDYDLRQSYLERDYYGFNQIELSESPVVIASGFYGDEFMLRNPFYVQSFIKEDIVDVFDSIEHCYMKEFFDLVYRDKCLTKVSQDRFKVKQMVMNDIQVWHLDKTYVYNPFRDDRLLDLIDCEDQVAIDQVTDGLMSKNLIKRFNPDLLDLLDKSKNTNDPHWFWQVKPNTKGVTV